VEDLKRFIIHRHTQRETEIKKFVLVLANPSQLGWSVLKRQSPAGIFYPAQGRLRTQRCEPLIEKCLPVVRRHLVQRGHHIIKSIGDHLRWAALAAMEYPAKIVERFGAVGLFTN